MTTDDDEMHPALFAGVAVLVLITAVLLAWGMWPESATTIDPTAVVADSVLVAEATIARTDTGRELARADSVAAVIAGITDRNAALAAEIDRLHRRTDGLTAATARTVHALSPDSLARRADRTLELRLRSVD